MFVKQIGLAALAATILAGGAAVANADSNVAGVDGGPTSEPALQRGYSGFAYAPLSSGSHAYGYAGPSRHYVRHHHVRTIRHRY
jgi:hypothetical protein